MSETNKSTEDLRKLLVEIFIKLDNIIEAVENRLKENHEDFLCMLNVVANNAKTSIVLAQLNPTLQTGKI